MPALKSNMIELGTKAHNFNLINPRTNEFESLNMIKSDKATVVMFICNHCPYVVHISKQLASLAKEYQLKGVAFVGINSNDVANYPDDSPEKMVETAIKENYSFPYLFDETQEVAKLYGAACTPDIFVYNGQMELVYRGQFDDSRPSNGIAPNGGSLRKALDEVLISGKTEMEQIPSIGCSIKWKA